MSPSGTGGTRHQQQLAVRLAEAASLRARRREPAIRYSRAWRVPDGTWWEEL